jgi:predicted transcriptional regulator
MHITAAESKVMEALWRRSPLSADELISEVTATQPWGEATVKTLINRLLKKKAIKSERENGRHCYKPLVERAEYVQAESQGLLDRLFDGQLAPLVAHFAEHRKLKADEVARLKSLIEELDDGDRRS